MGREFRCAAALAAALAWPSASLAEEEKPPAPPPAGGAVPGVLRVTVRQAVAMAMEGNLDLRASSYGPPVAAARVRQEEALYDHLFTARTAGAQRRMPVPSTFLGDGKEIAEDTFSAGLGLERLLATGGTVELSAGVDRTLTNSALYQINPYWDSTVALTFRQPLLRRAGRNQK